jgi:hypothetical protein
MAFERLVKTDLKPKVVGYYTMYIPEREIPADRTVNVIVLEHVDGKQVSTIPQWERGDDKVLAKVVVEALKKLNGSGVFLTSGLEDRLRYSVEQERLWFADFCGWTDAEADDENQKLQQYDEAVDYFEEIGLPTEACESLLE